MASLCLSLTPPLNRLSICCCASSDSSSGTGTSSSGSTTSVSQPHEAWTVTGTHTHHARRFTLQMKTPVEISLRPMHTPAVHYAIEELKPKDDEVGSPTGAMVEKVADPESRVQPGDVLVEVRTMGENEPWGVEDAPFEDIVAAVNQKGTQVALTFERFPQQDVEPGEFMAGHSS
ncbi:hypothetical protein PPROV_000421900 [Pycnococcus provasolii]|uniref:PDZ domain-containing protein n=1 Tax=Pycnococcus provasolii TaxID=41880 RepID=A0A830HJK9_9CHLO|nr:hypothetical protein PPROV_000421900 [Pycnococcus provasolii]